MRRLAAAALALALVCTPLAAFERWCWDPVPDADGYRLYWVTASLEPVWVDHDGDGFAETLYMVSPAAYPTWTACQRFEVAETCTPQDPPHPGPNEIVFLMVTAFNAAGESGTGWGEGTTHGPVEPCAPGAECPPYPTFPCP